MAIYAKFSAQPEGALRGLYHTEGDNLGPPGSIKITPVQWEDLVKNQAFRRWNGEAIVEIKPQDIVVNVSSVSSAQAQTALFNAGLLDEVEMIVSMHPYRPVKIFYDRANTWEIDNPYVRAIALELSLITIDEDGENIQALQDLFNRANKI